MSRASRQTGATAHLSADILVALADGALSDLDLPEVQHHVDTCAQCASELSALLELLQHPLPAPGPAPHVALAACTRSGQLTAAELTGSELPDRTDGQFLCHWDDADLELYGFDDKDGYCLALYYGDPSAFGGVRTDGDVSDARTLAKGWIGRIASPEGPLHINVDYRGQRFQCQVSFGDPEPDLELITPDAASTFEIEPAPAPTALGAVEPTAEFWRVWPAGLSTEPVRTWVAHAARVLGLTVQTLVTAVEDLANPASLSLVTAMGPLEPQAELAAFWNSEGPLVTFGSSPPRLRVPSGSTQDIEVTLTRVADIAPGFGRGLSRGPGDFFTPLATPVRVFESTAAPRTSPELDVPSVNLQPGGYLWALAARTGQHLASGYFGIVATSSLRTTPDASHLLRAVAFVDAGDFDAAFAVLTPLPTDSDENEIARRLLTLAASQSWAALNDLRAYQLADRLARLTRAELQRLDVAHAGTEPSRDTMARYFVEPMSLPDVTRGYLDLLTADNDLAGPPRNTRK